ncbi:MAG: UDP-N-acetylmuramoyl-tripeptide--D-alanyl-D-alanine ligase [Spirochaetes bacterium]|nr:UDP-N-acetylmuramoyl-tripeptide--D-alanyl-D-alanine ligase [Spirochaetota bacterium]
MTAAPAALFSVADLADAVGGRQAAGPATGSVASVSIDSRSVEADALFVALPGERTNGHRFLAEAATAGARALLVSEAEAGARRAELADLASRGVAVIAVPDTLAGLQRLARVHLARLRLEARVGVTGSSGKTTTKEILGAILSRTAPTAVSEGNLNSETGVPLACFRVGAAHRWAVLEMAVNHPGEMAALADIVRPDLALITNIGTAHIGLLGSREGIALEKKAIFSRFTGRETGFLPEGERFFGLLAEGVRGRIVAYGPGSTPGYGGSESLGLDGTLIHWEGSRARFPLGGDHNLANAIGAAAVARELGVPASAVREGLEAVQPLFGRSEILQGRGATVLFDGYNANPDSMERALDYAAGVAWVGRRVAVLGGMRELGAESAGAHRALAASTALARFDLVFLLGEEMRAAFEAMAGTAAAARAHWEADAEGLGRALAAAVREGDLVLVKGSRGLELEQVLPSLGVAGRGTDAPHSAEGRR